MKNNMAQSPEYETEKDLQNAIRNQWPVMPTAASKQEIADMRDKLNKLRGLEPWIKDREMRKLFSDNLYFVIDQMDKIINK